MRYSKGVMWLDDCRIPFTEDGGWGKRHNQEYPEWKGAKNFTHGEQHLQQNDKGRFTPNLLVCDDMLNDGSVGGIHKNYIHSGGSVKQKIYGGGKGIPLKANRNIVSDKGTNSRYYDLDKWFDKIINELI